MKTHDFQHLVDEQLAWLSWDEQQSRRIMQETRRPYGKTKRRVLRWTLVILCLLACTTACAAMRPAMIRWLVGNQPASQALEASVQPVYAEASAEGVTVRITGAICDGEKLVFSYEVENETPSLPVLVALDGSCLLDGMPVSLWGGMVGEESARMSPSPHLDMLPVRRNPFEEGCWSGRLPETVQGTAVCQVTFRIYRPEKGFAVMAQERAAAMKTETDVQYRAELKDSIDTLRSFQNMTLIPEDEASVQAWQEEGYTIVDADGRLATEESNMREAAVLSLSIPVRIQEAYVLTRADEIELTDCTVQVERIRLSPLSTTVQMLLTPVENTKEAAQRLAEHYGEISLTDQQGNSVVYADMDYMMNSSPNVQQRAGQWVCAYNLDMPGLQVFPQSIGLCIGGQELLRIPWHTQQ